MSIYLLQIIHQLLPTVVLSYLIAIPWSSAFEMASSKIEMMFLGGLRRKEHPEIHHVEAIQTESGNGTWAIDPEKNVAQF